MGRAMAPWRNAVPFPPHPCFTRYEWLSMGIVGGGSKGEDGLDWRSFWWLWICGSAASSASSLTTV